ncbi:MAG: peptidoglycan-associated lipoprotein Pal [Acidobacteriota bacterium]
MPTHSPSRMSLVLTLTVLSLGTGCKGCKGASSASSSHPTSDVSHLSDGPNGPSAVTDSDLPVDVVTKLLADIHFDFDKSDIREDAKPVLTTNTSVLKKHGFPKLVVEGHCDERGSVEYNLALGERRAKAAKEYLVSLGVGEDRISTVSYGKELPFAAGHDEDAWAQNRRAHFLAVSR